MPGINDYKCDKCGFTDEYIDSISVEEKPPEICPKCNEGKMEKQFGFNSLYHDFKGSGFYINDYGPRNWKRGKTANQIADCLVKNPETGKYKDPY